MEMVQKGKKPMATVWILGNARLESIFKHRIRIGHNNGKQSTQTLSIVISI